MLRSLTIMTRNLITSSVRSQRDLPRLLVDDAREAELDIRYALGAVGSLVSEILTEGLTWSHPEEARRLLSEALDFYHAVLLFIYFEDSKFYSCFHKESRSLGFIAGNYFFVRIPRKILYIRYLLEQKTIQQFP